MKEGVEGGGRRCEGGGGGGRGWREEVEGVREGVEGGGRSEGGREKV